MFDLMVSFLYTQIYSVTFLFILRLTTGVLFEMAITICNTTLAKLVPSQKRGIWIGYYNMDVIGIGMSLAIFRLLNLYCDFSGIYSFFF